jgi:alanine racemase
MEPENTSFSAIIHHQLEPEIYSLKGLYAFFWNEQKNLEHFPIHIKLIRNAPIGFWGKYYWWTDMLAERKYNCSNKKSICLIQWLEHKDFANAQIYSKSCRLNYVWIRYKPLRHSTIKSVIFQIHNTIWSDCWIVWRFKWCRRTKQLENVGTLNQWLQIRTISAGESVGYGRRLCTKTNKIKHDSADGISRGWGMGWFVMIKDSKAYIVGSICMDMLMVDVNLNVKKVMRYLFLGKSFFNRRK